MFSSRVPESHEPNPWSAALAARKRAGAPLIDLTEANPTRVGLPSLIEARGASLDARAVLRYQPDPRGLAAARRAVAEYAGGGPSAVSPEDVVLTTGTSESFAHLLRLLADPGDTVLVPRPGYPLFDPIAAAEGVRTASWRLAWDGAWHLDRAGLERALAASRPRAIACVEPHLPAGVRLPEADWEFLVARAGEAGVPLILDEVFADSSWSSPFARRAGPANGLVFRLGGLSKTCGLPQLKLGWIVVEGEPEKRRAAVRRLEWISDLFLSVATPVQHQLPELLARREEFQAPLRERLRGNLARLDRWIEAHPEVSRLAADGGWVALLRLPGRKSDEAWSLGLMSRGVAVHPGHFFDLELPATVVVSLIVEPRVLEEGLAGFDAVLGQT